MSKKIYFTAAITLASLSGLNPIGVFADANTSVDRRSLVGSAVLSDGLTVTFAAGALSAGLPGVATGYSAVAAVVAAVLYSTDAIQEICDNRADLNQMPREAITEVALGDETSPAAQDYLEKFRDIAEKKGIDVTGFSDSDLATGLLAVEKI